MDTQETRHVQAIIVSRLGCFRCGEIKEILESNGVPVKVVHWHDGGGRILAEHNFIPKLLPATMLFEGDTVTHKWSGLADFLVGWEELHEKF